MILVDTSVWVAHFRHGNSRLQGLLEQGQVLSHPFVVGELACGNLRNRSEILSRLGTLPRAAVAEPSEMLGLIETRRLWGRGLGWVDVSLLASTRISGCTLWTLDRALHRATDALGVSF